ncbi:MAG: 4-hydroxy-tetrahydrodipicolinate reductase [Flavobacteriaceae bacterium]
MKIALLGYGRMGQTIERLAAERGHQIVLRVDPSHDSIAQLHLADIAIDFSIPDVAFDHITACFEQGVPVVSGTTGWLDRYDEACKICIEKDGAFIYGSNFSLGVNLFFELNKKLAELMKPFDHYQVGMTEIHHTKKLDAPSGTAISLAEHLKEAEIIKNWTIEDSNSDQVLKIEVERTEDVPGTHSVSYNSSVDELYIKHTAHNREGFALGAIIAAEWLQDKQGIYSMRDVLNL